MKTLKILAGAVIILVSLILVLSFSLDNLVKSQIEEKGSELLQTQVTVNEVAISLFGGSGTINGFTINNPEDFSDEPALFIQEATLKLDIMTLLSDEVIVNEVIINDPEILFEQKGIGINLKTLNDNLDSVTSEPSGDSESNLIIERLIIKDGKVVVSSSLDRDRTTEVSLSEITLNDIGRDGNSTFKKSVKEILEPVFQDAIEEALKSGVTQQIEDKVRGLFDN